MDPVTEIFAAFGNSPKRLSDATGIKIQTVCDWRRKAPVNIPDWRRATVLDALKKEPVKISARTLAYLNQVDA